MDSKHNSERCIAFLYKDEGDRAPRKDVHCCFCHTYSRTYCRIKISCHLCYAKVIGQDDYWGDHMCLACFVKLLKFTGTTIFRDREKIELSLVENTNQEAEDMLADYTGAEHIDCAGNYDTHNNKFLEPLKADEALRCLEPNMDLVDVKKSYCFFHQHYVDFTHKCGEYHLHEGLAFAVHCRSTPAKSMKSAANRYP